jgi:hypothetical protein
VAGRDWFAGASSGYAGLYLAAERSGVGWLLDPALEDVGVLGRAVSERGPDTACDPDAVAADLGGLPDLLRERHFGVATGHVGQSAAEEADRIIAAAQERVTREQPGTWGEAIGDLADQLRICLRDRHVGIAGAHDSNVSHQAADQDGPALEVADRGSVLCVRIRRLWGGPQDDRLLHDWAQRGRDHFQSDRIVVDLRGNPGGNDAFLSRWIAPVRSADRQVPGQDAGWYVQGAPLGLWNPAALIEAADGLAAVPQFHRDHRHHPAPGDVLETREDPGEAVPAGEQPWHGRMLVVVDNLTFSSGETSAWTLQHALGARLIGTRTGGALEYGNIAPYLLPASGMCVRLATKRNDWGIPVELTGLPIDYNLDPTTPITSIASCFDTLHAHASTVGHPR